jgi:hypothetical protein
MNYAKKALGGLRPEPKPARLYQLMELVGGVDRAGVEGLHCNDWL